MVIASAIALPKCETVCANEFCRGRDQIEDTLKQGCVSANLLWSFMYAYTHTCICSGFARSDSSLTGRWTSPCGA